MAGVSDDVLFCINGIEHRINRRSETLIKDSLNDYIRRQSGGLTVCKTLIWLIRHHLRSKLYARMMLSS